MDINNIILVNPEVLTPEDVVISTPVVSVEFYRNEYRPTNPLTLRDSISNFENLSLATERLLNDFTGKAMVQLGGGLGNKSVLSTSSIREAKMLICQAIEFQLTDVQFINEAKTNSDYKAGGVSFSESASPHNSPLEMVFEVFRTSLRSSNFLRELTYMKQFAEQKKVLNDGGLLVNPQDYVLTRQYLTSLQSDDSNYGVNSDGSFRSTANSIDNLATDTGNLDDLTTTAKTSIVDAVNEINATASGKFASLDSNGNNHLVSGTSIVDENGDDASIIDNKVYNRPAVEFFVDNLQTQITVNADNIDTLFSLGQTSVDVSATIGNAPLFVSNTPADLDNVQVNETLKIELIETPGDDSNGIIAGGNINVPLTAPEGQKFKITGAVQFDSSTSNGFVRFWNVTQNKWMGEGFNFTSQQVSPTNPGIWFVTLTPTTEAHELNAGDIIQCRTYKGGGGANVNFDITDLGIGITSGGAGGGSLIITTNDVKAVGLNEWPNNTLETQMWNDMSGSFKYNQGVNDNSYLEYDKNILGSGIAYVHDDTDDGTGGRIAMGWNNTSSHWSIIAQGNSVNNKIAYKDVQLLGDGDAVPKSYVDKQNEEVVLVTPNTNNIGIYNLSESANNFKWIVIVVRDNDGENLNLNNPTTFLRSQLQSDINGRVMGVAPYANSGEAFWSLSFRISTNGNQLQFIRRTNSEVFLYQVIGVGRLN